MNDDPIKASVSDSTSSPAFFEAMYRKNPDPWDFAKSEYELRRYEAIIFALGDCRYRRAFEPGCSVGVLTERLAEHCDEVYAVDFSATAATRASARCAHLRNVEVRCGSITDTLPADDFDLLVLSEIGYYFDLEEWRQISSSLVSSIPAGATVLAAHWLGQSEDHPTSGDQVHAVLRANPMLSLNHEERHESFRLDRLAKIGG